MTDTIIFNRAVSAAEKVVLNMRRRLPAVLAFVEVPHKIIAANSGGVEAVHNNTGFQFFVAMHGDNHRALYNPSLCMRTWLPVCPRRLNPLLSRKRIIRLPLTGGSFADMSAQAASGICLVKGNCLSQLPAGFFARVLRACFLLSRAKPHSSNTSLRVPIS